MADNKTCASASTCSQESCEGCPSNQGPQSFLQDLNQYSSVKKVIAVVSGKGGVGKSFVTASLANELTKKGYAVGILDADVTGPSIPKMFGVHGPAKGNDLGMFPIESKNGIKIMSVNLLLENEEAPVIWRGPVIAGAVTEFWTNVVWGDLDYLLIDLPPGTGDVPLTVFQSIPIDGIVIVTSPQELVGMIVKKAYNMAVTMNVPVVGVVENFSYVSCPDCGKKIQIFGESHVEETAKELNIPLMAQLPIHPEFASLADEGKFEEVSQEELAPAIELLEK
jgi:Mrp family chromosome partitioning ATPase